MPLFDISENDLEFDRLNSILIWSEVEAFALATHKNDKIIDSKLPLLNHLCAVSKIAERYANLYFEESSFFEQSYWKSVCKSAGLLHETMNHGKTYEEVVSHADEAVASIVSSLTPDHREPKPKRLEAFANRVGISSEAAKLVKLADLRHESIIWLRILSEKRNNFLAEILVKSFRLWIESVRSIIPVLNGIHESVIINDQINKLRLDIRNLEQLVRNKRNKR